MRSFCSVRLWQAALVALLATLAACDVSRKDIIPTPPPPVPPDVAPGAKPLPSAEARPTALSPADLPQYIRQAGKPVVINFWATWCQPCVKEMPELSRFFQQYADRGVAFMSVSVDSPDAVKDGKVDACARDHKLPFPVHVLTDSDPAAVGKALGMEFTAVPTTLVYGADGKLVKSWQGSITLADLAAVVDPLLKPPETQR